MWFKNPNILSYLIDELVPHDGKYHDIQITNEKLYIDGKVRVDHSTIMYDKALSSDLVRMILREQIAKDKDIKGQQT